MDILSSGDTVSELFLLLSGTAEVISPDPAAAARHPAAVAPQGDSLQAVALGYASEEEGWPAAFGMASSRGSGVSGDIALNPNSPISMDVSGVRRPVEEGSVMVRQGCCGMERVCREGEQFSCT